MSNLNVESARILAAQVANEDDATLWRWFALLYEEGRIRWCKAALGWYVSVDHRHLSTEQDFDTAIRMARKRHLSGARFRCN